MDFEANPFHKTNGEGCRISALIHGWGIKARSIRKVVEKLPFILLQGYYFSEGRSAYNNEERDGDADLQLGSEVHVCTLKAMICSLWPQCTYLSTNLKTKSARFPPLELPADKSVNA